MSLSQTHTHTRTQTHAHTQTHTHILAHAHTHTHTHTYIQTLRETVFHRSERERGSGPYDENDYDDAASINRCVCTTQQCCATP